MKMILISLLIAVVLLVNSSVVGAKGKGKGGGGQGSKVTEPKKTPGMTAAAKKAADRAKAEKARADKEAAERAKAKTTPTTKTRMGLLLDAIILCSIVTGKKSNRDTPFGIPSD